MKTRRVNRRELDGRLRPEDRQAFERGRRMTFERLHLPMPTKVTGIEGRMTALPASDAVFVPPVEIPEVE